MAKANGKRSVEDANKVSADGEPAACESKGARAQNCRCHHKATPRSEELQRNLQKRLNRAIGQLNGVKAMIDDNRYCGDVLTQLAAAESAVRSISAILLQNHLETCVVEQIEAGNTAIIDEAMQLIKKFAR
ncbi:metal-sensing transcriptional repressor [Ellagibacter isourolithinifaciens]|uniref:metal-sensing transcriptional repressor n=1 Tax=Ellagibacter isourolithinifaciens TaxID=2137581 RepID=UPI002E75B853|nr:metal-sensing transcriptional repressor [Ellagibacter isourolithinifaciens]MEE0245870.1 metal-sensing transcriptional repressor [Ellagibacter isourolithinifaciens]